MLGAADVAVVTGESTSMVSEACASGRQVLVVELPLRHAGTVRLTKHARFLQDVTREGFARIVPVHELALAIRRAVAERRPEKPLDNFSAIRDRVGALL